MKKKEKQLPIKDGVLKFAQVITTNKYRDIGEVILQFPIVSPYQYAIVMERA